MNVEKGFSLLEVTISVSLGLLILSSIYSSIYSNLNILNNTLDLIQKDRNKFEINPKNCTVINNKSTNNKDLLLKREIIIQSCAKISNGKVKNIKFIL